MAIFDASNVTIARRAKLTELMNRHVRKHPGAWAIEGARRRSCARSPPLSLLISFGVHPPSIWFCAGSSISMVFIESICCDEQVIHKNMLLKCRLSADFKGMPLDQAMADLAERVTNYEKSYQTVRELSLIHI